MRPDLPAIQWIRPLATPYLRGYKAAAARSGSLQGWWFLSPSTAASQKVGFFAGFLADHRELAFLNPELPECLVLTWIEPTGGPLHRRLAGQAESLLRRTFDYIRWLTHRPPRFVFHAGQSAVLVRHQSMRDWPREKYEHFSRNFFIETLAWLVRSGLVRRLMQETSPARKRAGKTAGTPGKPSLAKVRDKRRGAKSGVPRARRSR